MTIAIGSLVMDVVEGEIVLPKWSGEIFTHPGTEASGVQLLPPVGLPFDLRLTRLDSAANLIPLRDSWLNQIGLALPIVYQGIAYAVAPYGLNFLVLDVSIVRSEVIPMAAGTRGSVGYTHSPASRLIADWRLVPIPAA